MFTHFLPPFAGFSEKEIKKVAVVIESSTASPNGDTVRALLELAVRPTVTSLLIVASLKAATADADVHSLILSRCVVFLSFPFILFSRSHFHSL